MAKTIFGTTEKSNFILNMELDWYRKTCAKLMLLMLWITAGSQGIHQLTYSINAHLSDMINAGGGGMIFALLTVMLRSIATLFSVMGVFAIIFVVIGLMRQQWCKRALLPYGMLGFLLLWAAVSLFHSYDLKTSFFGQDGRDEGLLALMVYASLFFLGSQLRRSEQQEYLLRGVMTFGIVQGIWGIMQAMPFWNFASQYIMIEPLLYQNMRLPSGLTDSPITYAMLLGMLGALSVPAELTAKEKKTRICAIICRCLALIMSLKTQTVAGLTAAGCILLISVGAAVCKFKSAKNAAVPMVFLTAFAAGIGCLWTVFTPSLNGTYNTSNDEQLANGLVLCDGGIVWDDGYYRLSTAGAYSSSLARENQQFEVDDAFSVLKYCREQGIAAIKIDPLLGVGPDNFYFTQLRSSYYIMENPNALDRPYNDYIYVAATRGIPSLLVQAALVIWCLVLAWKRRKTLGGWAGISAAGAVIVYALTAFTGISVLTVAPLFWILLGTLSAEPLNEQAQPAENKAAK